jgi:hypothetical protein
LSGNCRLQKAVPVVLPGSNRTGPHLGDARACLYSDSELDRVHNQLANGAAHDNAGLPNRLLRAFEVAKFVGCHEETVRRAYLRGLLVSMHFGEAAGAFTHATCWTGFGGAHRQPPS